MTITTISPAGRTMIEGFEGFRAVAYKPTPNDVWTCGYGHTEGVRESTTCTPAEADEWMSEDLRAAELAVQTLITVDLNQDQFDALGSFTFNLGATALYNSTLRSDVNEGNDTAAAQEFLLWDHQSGKVLPGLLKRRTAEEELFQAAVENKE